MNTAYRDILKHSAIYGVGQILSRLASLLLLPLYTSYLRPADYGVIALLDFTMGLLGILIGTGMTAAATRHHYEAQTEPAQRRVWWNGLAFLAIMATMIVLPAWLARGYLARAVLGGEVADGGYLFALAIPTLWFGCISQMPMEYLRVRKWSALFVCLSLTSLCLNIALNVFFLVFCQLGVAGVLLGNLINGAVLCSVLVAIFAWHCWDGALSWPTIASQLRFGLPIMVTSLLALLMHQADRYILRFSTDLHVVGIYSLGYAIGQAVNSVVLSSFSAIWSPVVYEIAAQRNAPQVFAQTFRYFVYALALMSFGISLFSDTIIFCLAESRYSAAADIVPIVCLAYLVFSLHEHFKVPVLLAKKTIYLWPSYVAGAIGKIVFTLVLVGIGGAAGAAWASVAAFTVFSFAGLAVYRQFDRYPYPLVSCGAAICGMIGSWVALRLASPFGLGMAGTLVCRALVWITWTVVLMGPLLRRWAQRPGVLNPCVEEAESLPVPSR